jgi:drug/metabolite transporter (DMT)-like permease
MVLYRQATVTPFVGEIAALLAALAFSITSVCYTLAGRKINSITAIAMSLPISWLIIMVIHRFAYGEFFPTEVTFARWFYLAASGILAFVVSSYFMLNAYQQIGPRVTMLIAQFAPVLGAILAWLFLGQSLPSNSIIGIALVTFGIIWVVAERGKSKNDVSEADRRRGVLNAALGTLAQGVAFIFASQGVAGGFPPLSASLLRIFAGVIALWLFIAFQRKVTATASIFKGEPKLFYQLTGAALFGPVIAGPLLLLSFQYIPVGVSTTLSHTTAIMLIPISYLVFQERITLRAILGTIVTISGIAILFI